MTLPLYSEVFYVESAAFWDTQVPFLASSIGPGGTHHWTVSGAGPRGDRAVVFTDGTRGLYVPSVGGLGGPSWLTLKAAVQVGTTGWPDAGFTIFSVAYLWVETGFSAVSLVLGASGTLEVWTNTEDSGTRSKIGSVSSAVPAYGDYHTLELSVTPSSDLSTADGTFVVRVDETVVLSGTGFILDSVEDIDCAYGPYTNVAIGSSVYMAFADIVFCEARPGSPDPTHFWGECAVVGRVPNGAGTYSDFTPLSGSNYSNVSDALDNDGDSTYVHTSTLNNRDTYTFSSVPSLTGLSPIYSYWSSFTRVTSAGNTAQYHPILVDGGVLTDTGAIFFSSALSYEVVGQYGRYIKGWALSRLNALEMGLQLTSLTGSDFRVTKVYSQVLMAKVGQRQSPAVAMIG